MDRKLLAPWITGLLYNRLIRRLGGDQAARPAGAGVRGEALPESVTSLVYRNIPVYYRERTSVEILEDR